MSLIRCLIIAVTALWLASCAVEPVHNRYQLPADEPQPGESAIAELQARARQALAGGDYRLAIEYLQRAIRIEPRNPHSWHYLGETYRASGDYRRCIEMVDRSFSYSEEGSELDAPNRRLRQICQSG